MTCAMPKDQFTVEEHKEDFRKTAEDCLKKLAAVSDSSEKKTQKEIYKLFRKTTEAFYADQTYGRSEQKRVFSAYYAALKKNNYPVGKHVCEVVLSKKRPSQAAVPQPSF